jgi:hypothetical protein
MAMICNRDTKRRLGLWAAAGAALALAAIATGARAQVATTAVQGTIYRADGTLATGTLLVSWPAFSTASDQAIAAGTITAVIGTDGFASVNLAPNAGAYPAGSYYTAVYHLSDGTVSREYWTVPATATASIASVRAQLAPATVAIQPVSETYVDSAIAAISANYLPLTGGTMSGSLLLNGDPLAANQAATKHYADTLAAEEVPLSGASMSGTLDTPNEVNKLPKVDVRHPDFGVGCANAADPKGIQDSTCPIEAALAWSLANGSDNNLPDVYVPQGTYVISAPLIVSCFQHFVGDGPNATIIKQTGNTSNVVTVVNHSISGVNLPYTQTCDGSIENMALIAPGGHLYTATLLEVQNAAGFTVKRVRGANGGGRGIQLLGSTERMVIDNTQWDAVRFPMVLTGNEVKVHDTHIDSPGTTLSDNYCYDSNNCPGGVYPAYQFTQQQVLESASCNGTLCTIAVQGGNSGSTNNGHSPLVAGHWFQLSAMTTLTNGFYQVASVTNMSPVSTQYTITFASTQAAATETITGAQLFQPAILPDQNPAVYMNGASQEFIGGSIKNLWTAAAFQTQSVFSGLIENVYCEGYPKNGQPHLNPCLEANGANWQSTLTSTIGAIGTSFTVASNAWAPTYTNDPTDAATGLGNMSYRIVPQDWVPGSTAASVYTSGVQQGQYENINLSMTIGNQAYTIARNQSGSTAPANTPWGNGSRIIFTPGGNYGAVKLVSVHQNSVDEPGANWAAYCNDAIINLVCAGAIVGTLPDGITYYGQANGGISVSVDFDSSEFWGVADGIGAAPLHEPYGEAYIKTTGTGQAAIAGVTQSTHGVGSEISTGLYDGSFPAIVNILFGSSGTVRGDVQVQTPTMQAKNVGGPFYEATVDNYQDPMLGQNPGSNYAMGTQFQSSNCSYDVPNTSQTHAMNRFCLKGMSGNSGWEYDVWNGSSWVNAFGISGQSNSTANMQTTGSAEVQGSLSAALINGEITVDGTTYASVNAAWNAAAALTTSTGKNQTVRLGPGTFNVTATLNEPSNGACVNLIGSAGATVNADSAAATTLTVYSSLGGDVFYLGNAAQAQGCTFRDFVILAATNATHGFEMQWFRGLMIDNVTVNDTTAEGILLGEESTIAGHQANFLLRNITVSYSAAMFTPANRAVYGVHIQKTAIDSHLDDITVRNALTAGVYNEGTGNTGYLIHGFGYPYTCTTAPCVNNASSSGATNASYATSYAVEDVGGAGSVWTDTYADSPAIAGFYVGANGVAIHGGHIQWPELTSFAGANLAYIAAAVTNNMAITDVDCLGMNSSVNWITYAGTSGNPPTFSSVHHLTGCGNYVQALEPAQVTGYSSGGANINDPSGAVPRVWATPIAAAASYPAFAAQLYTGYTGDMFQGHFSGVNPVFNVTYQGTIRTNGGLALSTVLNTASTLALTTANKNVIANASSGAQTLTLPSCYTAWPDRAAPTGLEFTIIKSDTSSNAITLQTVSSQTINYAGTAGTTLAITAAGKRTLLCGPDNNWYAF